MTARFTGKVALVTGGGSGIGRATAVAFARDGASVVVAGRNAEPLEQTVKLIQAAGGHASAVTADVSRSDDVARLVDATVQRYGGLHVAFNNAGVFQAAPVADMDGAAWDRIIAVNLTGVFLCMKYEIAHMRANGGGVIVNTASTFGAHARVPEAGASVASKAAVSALTRVAARESIAQGIRINVIVPGRSTPPCRSCRGRPRATATNGCATPYRSAASAAWTRSPRQCSGWPHPNRGSRSVTTSSSTVAPQPETWCGSRRAGPPDCQISSRVLPMTSRASMAACASAAFSSG
jgi:NAD(P)-dependent dehydrogenase (short-subunit alcohol dehydrogenase family)